MSNLFVLTWNPENWEWPETELSFAIDRTAAGELVADRWSVGARRYGIAPGDRAVLLRQHSERGLVASGTFTTDIFMDDHWDGSGRPAAYADLEWDVVVRSDDRLHVEELTARFPSVTWNRMQGSGVHVPDDVAEDVLQLWYDHLDATPIKSPDEPHSGSRYTEGAVIEVVANRYERDRKARAACIRHWGAKCSVCDLDFAQRYGNLGAGFIHVHHLRELSDIGHTYEVDPVKDLRPICPNCHAMVHRRHPSVPISKLREQLKKRGRAG